MHSVNRKALYYADPGAEIDEVSLQYGEADKALEADIRLLEDWLTRNLRGRSQRAMHGQCVVSQFKTRRNEVSQAFQEALRRRTEVCRSLHEAVRLVPGQVAPGACWSPLPPASPSPLRNSLPAPTPDLDWNPKHPKRSLWFLAVA